MDTVLLQNTRNKLEEIADTLYQGYVTQGIAQINEVIPNLAVIATWISNEEVQDRLINNALSPILEAMEEEDGTEIADLITYELLEILDTLN